MCTIHGKSAHASATPKRASTPADAITVAQTAIGFSASTSARATGIHGIVTTAAMRDIVPAETSSKWYIRARNLAELADLEPRVQRCFEAGAPATGAPWMSSPEPARIRK